MLSDYELGHHCKQNLKIMKKIFVFLIKGQLLSINHRKFQYKDLNKKLNHICQTAKVKIYKCNRPLAYDTDNVFCLLVVVMHYVLWYRNKPLDNSRFNTSVDEKNCANNYFLHVPCNLWADEFLKTKFSVLRSWG